MVEWSGLDADGEVLDADVTGGLTVQVPWRRCQQK